MKEKIIALRNEGKTYGQIKAQLGCSKSTIAYHVGAGQKEKSRLRQKSGRTAMVKKIREYKESVGCIDCGEMYPHYVLEFDHIDPSTKVANVSRLRSWKTAQEEMSKCEVVCGNCHNIRTWNRYQEV